MPTYQYACTECGHAFEQFQSFSEDALTVCPECYGKLRKLFNAVGVVFKGSGFYRNDSRSAATSSVPAASSSDASIRPPSRRPTSNRRTPRRPASTSVEHRRPSSSSSSLSPRR